jgi:hypothetical protein
VVIVVPVKMFPSPFVMTVGPTTLPAAGTTPRPAGMKSARAGGVYPATLGRW